MEYTTVYNEQRTNNGVGDVENFVRVSVHIPDNYDFPGLIKFQHGNNRYEDWEREWLLTSHNRETAIRTAQKMLDEYKLGKPLEGK